MLTDAGGKRQRVDRNAIAEKYLAVMEKQALKQHPTQQARIKPLLLRLYYAAQAAPHAAGAY
jgi:hypothetical protein